VAFAELLGIAAESRGNEIAIGEIILPWTQDCSGINTLLVLWGITLWSNRNDPINMGLFVRLALSVPAALIANALRILSIAAYRYVFYPEWEGEHLHYFFGFVWLLPLLLVFVKDARQKKAVQWLELLYLSVVLSLIAPIIFGPGGQLVALSALVFLSSNRMAADTNFLGYLVWALAGLLIAWTRMESLWVAWLLLCPLFVSREMLRAPLGWLILSGTVPLFAMNAYWQWVVLAALLLWLVKFIRTPRDHSASELPGMRASQVAVLGGMALVPLVAPGVLAVETLVETPPVGVMQHKLSDNSYKIRTIGQASEVQTYWYGAYGDGRHHSLVSCMRFRGVELLDVDGAEGVLHGGNVWMREFFIHDGNFVSDYGSYLLSSFLPFSPTGVHIIVQAPQRSMSADYFAEESERVARQLHVRYQKDRLLPREVRTALADAQDST
jgi:exosortase/archaeosortase family protein